MGRRLKNLRERYREARITLIGGLLIVSSPSIASILTSNSFDAMRFAGLGLQVLGLCIVLREVGQVRKALDLTPIWTSILNWFISASFVFRKPRGVHGEMRSELGRIRMAATGHIRKVYRPTNSDPVSKQIETVMKNIDELHGVLVQMDQSRTKAVETIKKELINALDEEKSDRKSLEKKVRAVLAENHAFEVLGVILILFGVVFATIPELLVSVWPQQLLRAST